MTSAGTPRAGAFPEVPAAAFEAVLAYLYTGQAAVTEYLQIAPLFDSVAACLEARLTPDNCRGSGVTAPVVRATASEEAVARASPVVA